MSPYSFKSLRITGYYRNAELLEQVHYFTNVRAAVIENYKSTKQWSNCENQIEQWEKDEQWIKESYV